MKTLKIHLKTAALFFSILIFFQGCTVYKSIPISIQQAVQNGSKVSVKTNTNEKLKFSRIIIADGKYFGVKKTNYTPLDENIINTVNEKDKTLSTILSIATSLVIIGVILLIAVDASLGSYGYL